MKKSFKTLLIAVALACVFAFGACAGGGGGLSGKYDSIVQLGGDYVIAYKDGAQRVFKGGKAGDKAFYIEAVGDGDEFFDGQKTVDGGRGLMDKRGRFMKYDGPKITGIDANVLWWSQKNKKGVSEQKHEVTHFNVLLDLSKETNEVIQKNNRAIMTTKGKLLDGRYSKLTANGNRIIVAEKVEIDNLDLKTFQYALKTDGTQIGRRVASGGSIVVETNAGKSVVSIIKETAPDANGNFYDIYDQNGNFISESVSWASPEMLGLFTFTKKTAAGEPAKSYVIKKDFSVEERGFTYLYGYNNAYYTIEGKTEDNSFKLKTVNENTFAAADKTEKGYKALAKYTSYLRGQAADDKYDFMLLDGTMIVSGIPDADKDNFYFTLHNQYENLYSYIVKNGDALEGKHLNAAKVTKTLESGETLGSASATSGWAVIKKDGANAKLWIVNGGKAVDITMFTHDTDYILVLVKKGDKQYYYASLKRNLQNWDGVDLLKGNLIAELGGITTEAGLDIDKFDGEPTISFTLNTSAAAPTPKAKSYAVSYANTVAADKASRKLPRMISNGSVKYALKKEGGGAGDLINYYGLAYGLNDNYSAYAVKALGEDERFSGNISGPFAATYADKGTEIFNVYKVETNKKGEPVLKEILKGVRLAGIISDGLNNYYIKANAANGTHEVYSETGKLMLKGGRFDVEAIVNYNAAVWRGNVCGIIKLNKNGGYKMLTKLEWYDYDFFADGSFCIKDDPDNSYERLYNASGKLLEKNAVGGGNNHLDSYGYNSYRVYFNGAKEAIGQWEVVTGGGVSKIFTVKITEKMLNGAAITSRLTVS